FRMISPRNLLSFGPNTKGLELNNLNVLIGPDGSGKSNLLEAISLLRASPMELRPVIARGGGVAEWIWKGAPRDPARIAARFCAVLGGNHGVEHQITFEKEGQVFRFSDESIGVPEGEEIEDSLFRRMPNRRPSITYMKKGKRVVGQLATF